MIQYIKCVKSTTFPFALKYVTYAGPGIIFIDFLSKLFPRVDAILTRGGKGGGLTCRVDL